MSTPNDRLEEALSARLDDGGLLTGWVVVYETLEDGERYLHVGRSEELTLWHARGMLLEFGLAPSLDEDEDE